MALLLTFLIVLFLRVSVIACYIALYGYLGLMMHFRFSVLLKTFLSGYPCFIPFDNSEPALHAIISDGHRNFVFFALPEVI